ncbi:MAG: cysteine hydrolase [Bacteroidales bacterium]|nr:MAG: cysteine hydrolase [Bacteroidales bacterium]
MKTALLIIDVQDFYFPGGKSELVNPQVAADKAALLLAYFREKGMTVIHVKHESKTQSDIQKTVTPIEGEKIITKKEVSSFNGTDLDEFLNSIGVKNLVVCGMQTHMCVEGAVRAGYDLGYKITLIHDACATKDLKWGDEIVPAKMVHLSTLSTLKAYAKVVSVEEFLIGK